MVGPVIASIVAALTSIAAIAEAHPALAKKLAEEVRDLIDGHEPETIGNIEARRAMAAGIAAACANAVQAAARRHG